MVLPSARFWELVCWLSKIAVGDWLTVLIAIGSLVVLFRWKVSYPLLVGVTAVIGLIAFPLLQPQWVLVK
jgi:chromate transporter